MVTWRDQLCWFVEYADSVYQLLRSLGNGRMVSVLWAIESAFEMAGV